MVFQIFEMMSAKSLFKVSWLYKKYGSKNTWQAFSGSAGPIGPPFFARSPHHVK